MNSLNHADKPGLVVVVIHLFSSLKISSYTLKGRGKEKRIIKKKINSKVTGKKKSTKSLKENITLIVYQQRPR